MAKSDFVVNDKSYTATSGLTDGDLEGLKVISDNTKAILEAIDSQKLKALKIIGMMAESYAKEDCPVDTGRLRNSITHTLDENYAYVGTNVEYAKYVENGTSRRKGKHFLYNAAANHKDEYAKVLKKMMTNA